MGESAENRRSPQRPPSSRLVDGRSRDSWSWAEGNSGGILRYKVCAPTICALRSCLGPDGNVAAWNQNPRNCASTSGGGDRMNRIGVTPPYAADRGAPRDRGCHAKRSRQPRPGRPTPLGVLGLLSAAIAIGWAAPPADAAPLSARTESCSHVTQNVTTLQTENCVFDNETGVDTPLGPLAIASNRDPFKDGPYNYFGQATSQAAFGHVGTFRGN